VTGAQRRGDSGRSECSGGWGCLQCPFYRVGGRKAAIKGLMVSDIEVSAWRPFWVEGRQ
jgi:hypothetical protein